MTQPQADYSAAKARIEKARDLAGGLGGFGIRPMKPLPPVTTLTTREEVAKWGEYVHAELRDLAADIRQYIYQREDEKAAWERAIAEGRGWRAWFSKRRRQARKEAEAQLERSFDLSRAGQALDVLDMFTED